MRFNDVDAILRIHSGYPSPLGIKTSHHIASECIGHGDLDGHDRLQEHWLRLRNTFSEGMRASDLEGDFRRINRVICAIVESNLQVHNRALGKTPLLNSFNDPFPCRRDIVLRYRSPNDPFLKLKASASGQRLDPNKNMPVLTVPPGLLLMLVLRVDRNRDRFLIGYFRNGKICLQREFPLHFVADNLQLCLPIAGEDGLPGISVPVDGKGGILLVQLAQYHSQLIEIRFRPGVNCNTEAGGWELDWIKGNGVILPGKCSTDASFCQLRYDTDIPGDDPRSGLLGFPPHGIELADPLGLSLTGIPHAGVATDSSAEYPQIAHLSHVGIGTGLKNQCR